MQKINRGGMDAIKVTGEGKQILLVGSSGSGKTIFIQNYAKDFRRHYGKVIYITEKHISAMENAFMCIDTLTGKQKHLLDAISMPEGERYPEKVEIYHPFTFDFPTSNVPDNLKLFTFSIKEVDPSSYAALIGRSPQSPATILCKKVAENISKNEDLFSFLYKIYEKSQVNDNELSIASLRQTMGIPIESYGSKSDVQQITAKFSSLETHYILQRDTEELNLTEKKWKEIIQDTDTITMFTGWKIPEKDKYIRYFITIELLLKIKEYLPKYAKGNCLILLEEIKILLPRSVVEGSIEEVLANIIREILAGIRSSGVTILMTTQSYNQTSSDLRSGVPDENIVLMKLSAEDIKSFTRDFKITKHNYDTLVGLKTGEFVFLKDILGENEIASKFRCFYVPFAHREDGYKDFVIEFKKRHPTKVFSHKDTIKRIKKDYEESFERHIQHIREEERKKKERKKREQEEKSTKNLPEPTESVDLSKKCYEFVLHNPDLSWNARVALFDGDISRNTMQKLAVKYALEANDLDFIQRFSSRAFVKSNFPNESAFE